MSIGLTLANLEDILSTSHETGKVTRTVGDTVFYVTLHNGSVLGLQPERLLVRSPRGISRYTGQSFRKLGLISGADVEVYGAADPETPDVVVVDVERRSSLLRRIFSD